MPEPPLPGAASHARAAAPVQPRRFSHEFTAGDAATREVLQQVVGRLTVAGLAAEDIGTVELILAEALNNVVEHAYGYQPGPVRLSVELADASLRCQIADRGQPMPTGEAPDPPLPPIEPPAPLPEGGFGWHIIRCLSRDLTYRRSGDWNTLSLSVPLVEPV